MKKILGGLLMLIGGIGSLLSAIGLSYWWVFGIIGLVTATVSGLSVLSILWTGIIWGATALICGLLGLGLSFLLGAIGMGTYE